ncbi:MAG: site-specific integrase [Methylobacterium mesophilicum]|nr:site-specific integrase [Methylobacterium mesophilicum]
MATIASTGPTRLKMLLAKNTASNEADDLDVLAELDSDLVEVIDPDNESGQQRAHRLAVDLAEKNNLPADSGSEFMRLLATQVRNVLVELSAEDRAHFMGETAPPSLKRFSQQVPPTKPSITFGALAKSFLNNVLTVPPGRPRTMRKQEATLNFLVRHFGRDTPVNAIRREDAFAFRDLMAEAPANAVKLYGPDMPLRKLVKKRGDPKYSIMSHSTQTTYIEMAERLFEWAVDEDHIGKNPARDLVSRADKVPYEDRRDPYTSQELSRIFNAPIYTGCVNDERGYATRGPNIIRRSRFWLPLIALFTGMRPEEILQLGPDHVGTTKAGTTYFALTRDMTLKTKSSRREVPVHPIILSAGFKRFVKQKEEAGATLLFDDVPIASDGTRSGTWSKRYSTFSKKVGVKAQLNCFYSFRHNFRDAVRAASIPEEQGEMLQGWSGRSKTTGRGYGNGFIADQLAPWMAKITYDDLDLSHLVEPLRREDTF